MKKLLGLLSGGQITYWLAGGALAVIVVLGGWLRIEQLENQAAETRAAEAATARDKAIAETKQRDRQIAALERQAEEAAAAAARIEPIRREVHAAPRTSACVASPVIAAGIGRLRATRPGAAGRAGVPADLPARAAGP